MAMTEDDGKYHYLSRKHDGHYDMITTDSMGTMDKSESKLSGLPYVYDKEKEKKVDQDTP
jgi:hypothetical protein